jgi:hypothetical protein
VDARRADAESLEGLHAYVLERGHESFLTFQYDSDIDDYSWLQSRRAIHKAILMARRLDLIDEAGGLTSNGKNAVQTTAKYANVLRERIGSAMSSLEITPSTLDDAARALLRRNPPELPTAALIWEYLSPSMSRQLFATLLTLLAQTGGAEARQAKCYLAFREGGPLD